MKETILGIQFDMVSLTEALDTVRTFLTSNPLKRKGFYVVTPNPEFVMAAQKDPEFLQILNEADLSIPDGMGVVWASRILGKTIRARTSGADLVEKLLEAGNEHGWVFFFLGGQNGVACEAATKAVEKYPKLKIGCHEGEPAYGFDDSTRTVLKDFARTYGVVDMLLVAYGQKKQEKWIHRNLDHIPVRVAMGVGGVFDMLSGRLKRAPKPIQQLGLEWLFRLIQEPHRWRRQLALPKFAFLVFKEKLSPKK